MQRALLKNRKFGSNLFVHDARGWLCVQRTKIGVSAPIVHVMGKPLHHHPSYVFTGIKKKFILVRLRVSSRVLGGYYSLLGCGYRMLREHTPLALKLNE